MKAQAAWLILRQNAVNSTQHIACTSVLHNRGAVNTKMDSFSCHTQFHRMALVKFERLVNNMNTHEILLSPLCSSVHMLNYDTSSL